MPKISKLPSKKTTAKTKKIKSVIKKVAPTAKKSIADEKKIKTLIKISKTYIPKDTEKYMCDKHLVFFKLKLSEWKKELVKANNNIISPL